MAYGLFMLADLLDDKLPGYVGFVHRSDMSVNTKIVGNMSS